MDKYIQTYLVNVFVHFCMVQQLSKLLMGAS